MGLAIASAASLHSALLFAHNLATCEPAHPQGFSSLPTLHLPLPVSPTHAPKILLFSPQISPLLLGFPDFPWPAPPQSKPLIFSFVMSCKVVCTHAIIQATAFNYLFVFLQKKEDKSYLPWHSQKLHGECGKAIITKICTE